MSTYTDLHLRNKENITVLRMPGNPYDGMTSQRVIFANPENIYNGRFVGELSTTSASFNDVTLNGCTVLDAVLSNAVFRYENREITTQDLLDFVDSSSLSIDGLSNALSGLSREFVAYGKSTDASISTISSDLSTLSSKFESYVETNDKDVSTISINLSGLSSEFKSYVQSTDAETSAISVNLSELSGEFKDYVEKNDVAVSTISNDLSDLSSEFTSYAESNTENVSAISISLSGLSSEFIDYSTTNDAAVSSLSSNLSGLSSKFEDYAVKNDDAVSTISGDVIVLSGEFKQYAEQNDSSVSTISIDLSTLSSKFEDYAKKNDVEVSTISNDLSGLSSVFEDYVLKNDASVSTISGDVAGLSGEFIQYSQETDEKIETLQKQVDGGVVYKGKLTIDYIYVPYPHTLQTLLTANGIDGNTPLSVGYFYIAQTVSSNTSVHFIYDGIELEHGDWLMVKNDCYASSITSADVDVVDAQDYDSFKLPDNNVATGDNVFTGHTTLSSTNFNGVAEFNSGIVVDGQAKFNSNTTFIAPVSANAISTESLNAKTLIGENAAISHLSVKLSAVSYNSISTLQDLSNDIYYRFGANANDVAFLCSVASANHEGIVQHTNEINEISNIVSAHSARLSDHMFYAGTMVNGYGQTVPASAALSIFLFDNFGYGHNDVFYKGTVFRLLSTITLCTQSEVEEFQGDDYLLFNKEVTLKEARLSDLDVIHDAEAEGEELKRQLYGLSSEVGIISGELSTSISTSISLVKSDITSTIGQLSSIDSLTENSTFDLVVKALVDVKNALSSLVEKMAEA